MTLSSDPGTEVRDLTDELRLTDDEARSWLDVPSHVPTADLVRLTGGYASDYVWCAWLADVLRAADRSVVEHEGWKTRGRPRSVGPFTPDGLIWHHDASPRGASPSVARFVFNEGRPAEGIPAPLCHLWVCAGCNGAHPVGTWHVGAAGRANHAGEGAGFRGIGADLGNTRALGVETDNTTGEPTPPQMYDSLVIGSAAILEHLGSDPHELLAGHKEYAAGRKIDPDDIDMEKARRDVAAVMRRKHRAAEDGPKPTPPVRPVPYPGGKHFEVGETCEHGFVALLGRWINDLGYAPTALQLAGKVFTERHRQAVARFQRDHDSLAGDPDGIPGPLTWRLLQSKHRARGR